MSETQEVTNFAIVVIPDIQQDVLEQTPDPAEQSYIEPTLVSPVETGGPRRSDSRLNPKYSFDNFVIGGSNRFAHAAAVAVAEAPAKAYNPLFIYGESGLGKTHLLHAIGHYAESLYPGIRVRYVSSEEFTNDFINSIANNRASVFQSRSGTFAQLGVAIENGFRMAINEQGGKLGGREIEFFKVDDESNPAKGIENAQRLVQRDKVDVLVGTVHSGVQMGIHKVARESGVLNLIPNAGVHIATRAQCAPNVFRTSFSNSQPTLALGKAMVDRGHKKAVWITWNYAAGDEAFEGFEQSYTAAGGTIVKKLGLCPSPTSNSRLC